MDSSSGSWTVVIDEQGLQILTTRLSFGMAATAEAMSPREANQLMAKGRVTASGLVTAATGKFSVTRIYLPVIASGGRRCILARVFTSDFWHGTAMQPDDDRHLIIGVVDRAGTIIVRNRMSRELLGKQASANLLAVAAIAPQGLIRSHTLEGVDAYVTFAHSDLTGWIVAVAAPIALIDGATTDALRWLTAGVILALLTALGVVTFYTRRVMFAIDGAVAAAQALGRGHRPIPRPGAFREINALNTAMIDAGRVLSNERNALAEVQAERLRMLDNERRVAEQHSAAKDTFIAMLGHELRNPLTAIFNATALLQRTVVLPEPAPRYVSIIDRNARSLMRIVNDLLDVSRMIAGKTALHLSLIDLGACITHCVEGMSTSEAGQNFEFIVDVKSVLLLVDPVRIEQVVSNLVGNSMKQSRPGSQIRVIGTVMAGFAVIEFSDDGAGIEADLLPRIFEAFVQGPVLKGQVSTGLGMGLTLVKQLVSLHGGDVSASSAGAGLGTIIRVRFPLGDALVDPPTEVAPAAIDREFPGE